MDHQAPPRIAPPRFPTPPRLRGGAGALVPRKAPTGQAALAIAALAEHRQGAPFLFLDTRATTPRSTASSGPLAAALDARGYDAIARHAHLLHDPVLFPSVQVVLFCDPRRPAEGASAVVYGSESGALVPLPFDVAVDAPWHDPVASAEARRAVLSSALAWFGAALRPIGMEPGMIVPWMYARREGWGPTAQGFFAYNQVHAVPGANPYVPLYQGIALAIGGAHDVDYAMLTLRGGVLGPTGTWHLLPEAFFSEPRTLLLGAVSRRRIEKVRKAAAAWGRAFLFEATKNGALPVDILLGWSYNLDGRATSLSPYPRHVIGAVGAKVDPLEGDVPRLTFSSAHGRLAALHALQEAAPTTLAALRAHPLPRIL